jgi:hypothetical protein
MYGLDSQWSFYISLVQKVTTNLVMIFWKVVCLESMSMYSDDLVVFLSLDLISLNWWMLSTKAEN